MPLENCQIQLNCIELNCIENLALWCSWGRFGDTFSACSYAGLASLQEDHFRIHPIALEINLYLVEIRRLPVDFKVGNVPFDVFANNLDRCVILGVKESRAQGTLLLAFANRKDQQHAVSALIKLHRLRQRTLLRSFSGDFVDFTQCHVEDGGTYTVVCSPVSQPSAVARYYDFLSVCVVLIDIENDGGSGYFNSPFNRVAQPWQKGKEEKILQFLWSRRYRRRSFKVTAGKPDTCALTDWPPVISPWRK